MQSPQAEHWEATRSWSVQGGLTGVGSWRVERTARRRNARRDKLAEDPPGDGCWDGDATISNRPLSVATGQAGGPGGPRIIWDTQTTNP